MGMLDADPRGAGVNGSSPSSSGRERPLGGRGDWEGEALGCATSFSIVVSVPRENLVGKIRRFGNLCGLLLLNRVVCE